MTLGVVMTPSPTFLMGLTAFSRLPPRYETVGVETPPMMLWRLGWMGGEHVEGREPWAAYRMAVIGCRSQPRWPEQAQAKEKSGKRRIGFITYHQGHPKRDTWALDASVIGRWHDSCSRYVVPLQSRLLSICWRVSVVKAPRSAKSNNGWWTAITKPQNKISEGQRLRGYL
ncbi:hypothetical protein BD289DRAFT_296429 [Coniella lustricola]|uniref:Uncharacterized protein n=1 Tax=Coniella lustricola TaxID=2025994 RepID=A0A2T3A4V6_9PEZI|nr:hypothetical protein BD289DRAFT_296429 [Coniella lustricola]